MKRDETTARPTGSAKPPSGTVTFLFTDIEGSTMLWEHHHEWMERAHKRQERIIRDAVAQHGGYAYKMIGDAFQIAFASARDALDAAIEAQRMLHAENWGDSGAIRVRMAMHTGVTEERGDDYVGPVLNRVARLLSAGHGAQVLLSNATEELVRDRLPANVSLRDLGEQRLRDLIRPEKIFQIVSPDLPSEFSSLKTLNVLPNNLPLQLTSFIGREKESEEIKRLFATTRLLTFTGAGGCGKTRLSLQVAADSLEEFADGAWFVELAPLADPALVIQAIASTFGLQEGTGRSLETTLTDYLREKNLLLILDNCEHLIAACAQFADTFLHACPHLKILATSREALGIAGETTYRVPSLAVPDLQHLPPIESLSQYDAVRLFIDRAISVQSTFSVNNHNAPAVAQICYRLDGIPLAIELAAARVKVLSAEEIEARLDDRFRLLTSGSRTALPRQQTLRAAIDWSYDLLSEPERVLLSRLSVFVGGWTFDAAEYVCAGERGSVGAGEKRQASPMPPSTPAPTLREDVLDLLSHLIDKSLVLAEEQDGTTRYRVLETIRQYAREKLLESGEDENVRNRHLEYFLKLAEEAEPNLAGAKARAWLNRLETEHDNVRLALDWSLNEKRLDQGLRFAGALYSFWFTRGYANEAYQRSLAILKIPGTDKRTLSHGKALLGAGEFAYWLGHFKDSHTLFEESIAILREVGEEARASLELALNRYGYVLVYHDLAAARIAAEEAARLSRQSGNLSTLAYSLNVLGNSSFASGDFNSARRFYEESEAKYRQIGDAQGYVGRQSNLGMTYLYHGELDRAQEYLVKSIGTAREMGMGSLLQFSLLWLGNLERVRGHYDEAEALFNQGLGESRKSGGKTLAAYALAYLGRLQLTKGNYVLAKEHLEESLTFFGHRDFRIIIPLEGFAFLSSALRQPQRAAQLFGAADALREKIGTLMWPIERAEYEPYLAAVRAQLDETSFRAAWAEGRAMTIEQAIEYALAEQFEASQPIASAQPHDPNALTPREIEVLRLARAGLSDAKIAEKLVISRRTVNTHLSSIYSKLGVNSRSAATRYALDHKLI